MLKEIKDFPAYLVSEDGQVFSKKSNKFLKLQPNGHGYLTVRLYNQGQSKFRAVHRLVAEAFIPNPDNLPEVNHKDEDKTNNCVSNLEWCDRKYNNNYGTKNDWRKIRCAQYDLDNNFIQEFESFAAAGRYLGNVNRYSEVRKCCIGEQKTAYGYIWKFV